MFVRNMEKKQQQQRTKSQRSPKNVFVMLMT